jgi:xylose isomerase
MREYGLFDEFELNIETNHATLAGHTMRHELTVAANAGRLGSIDANRGDELIGWDTDQFPTNIYLAAEVMLVVLGMGGFKEGGLNFDAKRRRESHHPADLFHAHIGGMDAFARGLKIAAAIRADGRIEEFVKNRYASWNSDLGKKILAGKASFAELEKLALSQPAPTLESGGQEYLENILNELL